MIFVSVRAVIILSLQKAGSDDAAADELGKRRNLVPNMRFQPFFDLVSND